MGSCVCTYSGGTFLHHTNECLPYCLIVGLNLHANSPEQVVGMNDIGDDSHRRSWQSGDVINVESEDGWEVGATILGPAASGSAAEMSVRFVDGVVADWDVNFIESVDESQAQLEALEEERRLCSLAFSRASASKIASTRATPG